MIEKLQQKSGHAQYEVCLKSNGTVHAARTTFIAEKKALLSMMSQCLMISNTKFQHSAATTFFFARFSVKALSLQRWSPRGRPWPRGRPRGQILKSLALASRPQVLENWPVLGSRTALFFELLKFCGALEKFFRKRIFVEIA